MPVYTCFEMLEDCRRQRRQGWSYFIRNYLPAIGSLGERYFPDLWPAGPERIGQFKSFLNALRNPERPFFASQPPAPERIFLLALRDFLLEEYEDTPGRNDGRAPEVLEALRVALESYTPTEKQIVWLETLCFSAQEAGQLMNASERTVHRLRERAEEDLRCRLENWSAGLLSEYASELRKAVRGLHTPDCPEPREICAALDGRTTWRRKSDLENHLSRCWHCVDLFCRVREADYTLTRAALRPLPDEQIDSLLEWMGLKTAKTGNFILRLFRR